MPLLSAAVANLLLFAAVIGLGNPLQKLVPESFGRFDRFACAVVGGIGLLGTLLYCIGVFWFSRAAILSIVLASAALGVKPLFAAARKFPEVSSRIKPSVVPAAVVIVVLLVTAVAGLAEPTGDLKQDAIAYHFLGPKVWLRDAAIHPLPDECYTAFPAVVETLFAALFSMGGVRAPGLFAVIALCSVLLAAAALALRVGLDARGAWWAAALLIVMHPLYRGAYGGFNDAVYSAFVLAGVRVGLDAKAATHYALFGLFCGFAMGTKYFGLIAFVLLALCVAGVAKFAARVGMVVIFRNLAIACAAAALVAGPWYLRNWLSLGSPVYPPPPFLMPYFQVTAIPPQALQRWAARIWFEGSGMGRSPLDFLLLPVRLTYRSANFLNGAGGIGLTPLAFAPFGLLSLRREWFVRALVAFALLQTVAWFVVEQDARFLIHVLVIAAILAVAGWRYVVGATSKLGSFLAAAVVACSISYGLFMVVAARSDDLRAVVSKSFAENRRREEIPFLEAFSYLNSEPAVSRVLVLQPRVPAFYLDKPYLKPIGRWGERALPDADDQASLLAELHRLGVSHVLDVRLGDEPFRLEDSPRGFELVFRRLDQRVYRVK